VHAAAAAHTASANERPRSEYALQACLGGKQLAICAARQHWRQGRAPPKQALAPQPARQPPLHGLNEPSMPGLSLSTRLHSDCPGRTSPRQSHDAASPVHRLSWGPETLRPGLVQPRSNIRRWQGPALRHGRVPCSPSWRLLGTHRHRQRPGCSKRAASAQSAGPAARPHSNTSRAPATGRRTS